MLGDDDSTECIYSRDNQSYDTKTTVTKYLELAHEKPVHLCMGAKHRSERKLLVFRDNERSLTWKITARVVGECLLKNASCLLSVFAITSLVMQVLHRGTEHSPSQSHSRSFRSLLRLSSVGNASKF